MQQHEVEEETGWSGVGLKMGEESLRVLELEEGHAVLALEDVLEVNLSTVELHAADGSGSLVRVLWVDKGGWEGKGERGNSRMGGDGEGRKSSGQARVDGLWSWPRQRGEGSEP